MKSLIPWAATAGLVYLSVFGIAPFVNKFNSNLIQNLSPLQPVSSSTQIRFLTANLWHDFPFHRDLEARWLALASAIDHESVDIACLQEVPWTRRLSNRAEWLGQHLNMAYVYGRANGDRSVIGFEEGVAIISRYPLHSPKLAEIQPQRSSMEHRVVLRAIAETPAGEVAIYCTHLTTVSRANGYQNAWLLDYIRKDAGGRTALIAGDFNAGDGSHAIRSAQDVWQDTFRMANPGDPGLTCSLDLPLVGTVVQSRFDYIFVQAGSTPLAVNDSRLLFTKPDQISDHHGVLTTFSLAEERQCERLDHSSPLQFAVDSQSPC